MKEGRMRGREGGAGKHNEMKEAAWLAPSGKKTRKEGRHGGKKASKRPEILLATHG